MIFKRYTIALERTINEVAKFELGYQNSYYDYNSLQNKQQNYIEVPSWDFKVGVLALTDHKKQYNILSIWYTFYTAFSVYSWMFTEFEMPFSDHQRLIGGVVILY